MAFAKFLVLSKSLCLSKTEWEALAVFDFRLGNLPDLLNANCYFVTELLRAMTINFYFY